MITALIAAGSALANLAGGVASARRAQREGERAQQFAMFNSMHNKAWGREQAMFTLASAAFNARRIQENARLNTGLNTAAINRNVQVLRQVSAYNALLADTEVESIYDALDLDKTLVERQSQVNIGKEVVRQAASGTVIGEGSNAEVVTSMLADEAVQKKIMDHNAENRALEIVNAKAQGQWETEMQIGKLTYEGELSAIGQLTTAALDSSATLVNAGFSSWSTLQNAENASQQTINTGHQQQARYNDQSQAMLMNGIFGAGRSLANSYASGQFDSLLTS